VSPCYNTNLVFNNISFDPENAWEKMIILTFYNLMMTVLKRSLKLAMAAAVALISHKKNL